MDGLKRLPESCPRPVWRNHPCGGEGYAPLAAGSRAIIKHVDDLRAVHDLHSLAQLTTALPRREEGLTTWQGIVHEGASRAPA